MNESGNWIALVAVIVVIGVLALLVVPNLPEGGFSAVGGGSLTKCPSVSSVTAKFDVEDELSKGDPTVDINIYVYDSSSSTGQGPRAGNGTAPESTGITNLKQNTKYVAWLGDDSAAGIDTSNDYFYKRVEFTTGCESTYLHKDKVLMKKESDIRLRVYNTDDGAENSSSDTQAVSASTEYTMSTILDANTTDAFGTPTGKVSFTIDLNTAEVDQSATPPEIRGCGAVKLANTIGDHTREAGLDKTKVSYEVDVGSNFADFEEVTECDLFFKMGASGNGGTGQELGVVVRDLPEWYFNKEQGKWMPGVYYDPENAKDHGADDEYINVYLA